MALLLSAIGAISKAIVDLSATAFTYIYLQRMALI